MNIEEFREYCLSLKGVHEKIKELVRKSYDIVVKSLTKKEREMLLSSDE